MLQKLNLTTKVLIAAFLLFIMVLFLVAFLSFNDASVMISESEAEVETINTPMKVEKESKADAEVVDVNAPIQAEEESEVFTIVEEMPEFPGGQKELFKFIGKNIKYPPMARENGIGGTVYVGFIVAEDGSIENVQIRHGLENCSECDAEAVRVVKEMPKWNPGKQRGKLVRVAFTLPIRIKLQ